MQQCCSRCWCDSLGNTLQAVLQPVHENACALGCASSWFLVASVHWPPTNQELASTECATVSADHPRLCRHIAIAGLSKKLASTAQLVKLSAGDGRSCDRTSQPVVCSPEVHAGGQQHPLARGKATRPCCKVSCHSGAHFFSGSHRLRRFHGRHGSTGQSFHFICFISYSLGHEASCDSSDILA